MMATDQQHKRVTRPRSKEVDYVEPSTKAPAAARVPFERHAEACLAGNFGRLKPLEDPRDLTVDDLRRSGFQDPVLVRADASVSDTREALGIRVPSQLSPDYIAQALGPDEKVRTIDVASQVSGPRMTLADWAEYFKEPEKERLLNVVSLSLAGTPLQEEVSPPAAVRELNLVDAVWPAEEQPRPEVLLYGLMSPAGCYTDFHVDFGGSSVWYHVVTGRKTFILVPPTPQNMEAFKEWSSSEKQAGILYADRAEGCLQASLGPGSTLLIPSSWPHAVVTQEDATVVGGNFLHAFDLRRAVECWDMESSLKVHASARFPLFGPLMWHTMVHYHRQLHPDDMAPAPRAVLTAWEVSGLMCVLGFLKKQMGRAGSLACPESIEDPKGLLEQTERAASVLMPEGILPDVFGDLDSLDLTLLDDIPEGLLLGSDPLMPEDLRGGATLPLPDVTSSDWLEGIAAKDKQDRPIGGEPYEEESDEASSENASSGDEWAADKQSRDRRSRGSTARLAKQQQLQKLKAAKAARDQHKRRAAQAAARLTAGGQKQQDGQTGPQQSMVTMKASARAAQAAREGACDGQREQVKAQMLVLHLRTRIHKELGMQAEVASGKLQLRDGGARLREGVAEAAARLANALSSLTQHGATDPPWPLSCFQAAFLRFIDADGQVQGPISVEHLKTLRTSGIVQDDTLVMAHSKGPSLLKDVIAMCDGRQETSAARSLNGPDSAHSGQIRAPPLARPSRNGHSANEHSVKASQAVRPPLHQRPTLNPQNHSSSSSRQDSGSHGSRHADGQWERSRPTGSRRSTNSRVTDAEEEQRKIDRARARRAMEQQKQEEARRRAYEEHRSRAAAAAAAQSSRSSWAAQAAAELAQAELAGDGDGAYQGSWTFMGSSGQEMGPFLKSELISMFKNGEIDGKTLVCDEEDGVTVEMSALAANTRVASALVQRPAPLPVPEAPAQRQPAQAALPRLPANGAAGGGDTKQQFYSALEGEDEEFEPKAPQATSPARPDAGQPSGRVAGQSGQYLPGLAPATELRKRASEVRQQHLAKLQRLAGGQVASSTSNGSAAAAEAEEVPPPPPSLPPGLASPDDMSAPAWQRQLESKDGRWQQHEHSRHPKQLAGGRGQYGAGQTKGQSSLMSNKSALIQQQQLAKHAGISASGSHVQQNVWRAQAQPQPYLASAGLPGSMGDGLPWSGGPAHSSNMSANQGDPRYKPPHAQPTWPVQSIADKALPGHIIPAEAPNLGQHTTAWHAAPYGELYSGRAPEQGAEGQRWYQR